MDRPMSPRALILAGPTAAGKSAVALHLAEVWDGVILSADAMQIYRGMDIGTASPAPSERERVEHYGVDVCEPRERYSAAEFIALGDRAFASGRPVIVVGGTSLYLKALTRGLARTPEVDASIRAEVEALPDAHGALAAVDPDLAARLHPNDHKRIVRGLEVFLQSGRRLSAIQAEHEAQPLRLHAPGLWLDRDDLDARIDARVGQMVEAGYVDEVRGLLDRGVSPDLPAMRTLGYRHLCEHLLHDSPLERALERTRRDTRRFARKQRNWRKHLGFPEVRREHLQAGIALARRVFGEP